MPTLAAALAEVDTKGPGLPCSMGAALDRLATDDPELHADILRWLDGDYVGPSDAEIHAVLQKRGYRVGDQQIGHHRRRWRGTAGRKCRCAL